MGNQPTGRKQITPVISIGAVQGVRHSMEDAHIARALKHHPSVLFAAVYDGHGGKDAAEYCKKHLHHHLDKKMPKEDDALRKTGKQAIEHSFVETDKKYFDVVAGSKPLNMNLLSAGTTANIILLDQLTGHLISANVGDSQTVVCRNGKAIDISVLHKPWREEERARIEASGHRVANGRLDGTLAVSRAIGDVRYKPVFADQLLKNLPGVNFFPNNPDSLMATPHIGPKTMTMTPLKGEPPSSAPLTGTAPGALPPPINIGNRNNGTSSLSPQSTLLAHSAPADTGVQIGGNNNNSSNGSTTTPPQQPQQTQSSPAQQSHSLVTPPPVNSIGSTILSTMGHTSSPFPDPVRTPPSTTTSLRVNSDPVISTATTATAASPVSESSSSSSSHASLESKAVPAESPPDGPTFWSADSDEGETWQVTRSPKAGDSPVGTQTSLMANNASGSSSGSTTNTSTVLSMLSLPSPHSPNSPNAELSANSPVGTSTANTSTTSSLLSPSLQITVQTPGGHLSASAKQNTSEGDLKPSSKTVSSTDLAPATTMVTNTSLLNNSPGNTPPLYGNKTPPSLTPPLASRSPGQTGQQTQQQSTGPDSWPLTPVPFVMQMDLDPSEGDEFIVLACDGLFDVMTSQAVVDWVRRRFRTKRVQRLARVLRKDLDPDFPQSAIVKPPSPPTSGAKGQTQAQAHQSQSHTDAKDDEYVYIQRSLEVLDPKNTTTPFKNLAQELCEYAIQCGSKDNVTAVIIVIDYSLPNE